MTDSNKSISLLRQRMIDDMTLRKLAPKTQAGYLRAVIKFSLFFGRSPDLASPEDLRRFQLHLVEQGVSSTTINATLTGLTFFFGVTLERPAALKRMSRVRTPQKLPQVLSLEEVERLLAGASNPKHRAALAVAYGAGLRASEVVHLKIADIDSERMIVQVVKARDAATATPCCHPHCWNCCGPGGRRVMPRARCCKAVGCSRDATRRTLCRPDNSIQPATAPPMRPALRSGFRCIPYDTALPLTCWRTRLISASSRYCLDTAS